MARVLIVTGGSRGIGCETSVGAARQGWDVCVNYVGNEERAGQTVAAIREAGQRAIKVKADISREEDVLRLFETCDSALGVPCGLVNSAGIVGPHGRIDEVEFKDIAPLMDVNINGTLLCTREAIKRMSTRHGGTGGSIVNLSSAASRLGSAGYGVPYAASKGAIDSLTWGVSQEVAGEGIRVNAVSPGVIDTEIQPEGRVESVGPTLPMRRAGQPEEVARAILWLLSDDASYVSGANLNVSGAR